jgi:hypothetical protein
MNYKEIMTQNRTPHNNNCEDSIFSKIYSFHTCPFLLSTSILNAVSSKLCSLGKMADLRQYSSTGIVGRLCSTCVKNSDIRKEVKMKTTQYVLHQNRANHLDRYMKEYRYDSRSHYLHHTISKNIE